MSRAKRRPHFLLDAAEWKHPFGLAIGDGPRLLARRVTLAGDSATRRRGLLDRTALDPDEGLIVAPTFAVHTFGMRFAVDVVFVDREGRVLTIAEGVRPRRVAAGWWAFAAVELPAGRCSAAGLQVGDTVHPTAVPNLGPEQPMKSGF